MDGLHRQQDCMQHCQKLGHGPSPQVNDPQQWQAMLSEIEAMAKLGTHFLSDIRLSVTEGDLSGGGKLGKAIPLAHNCGVDQGEVPLVANETIWRDY